MSVKKLLGAAMWQGLLLAMLTLLALLAVSSLMLQRGLLPESAAPSMVCAACAAAVFAGSRRAVRKGEGGPLPQAAAVAVCLYAALWLIALGGTPQFSIHGPAVTASVFGGNDGRFAAPDGKAKVNMLCAFFRAPATSRSFRQLYGGENVCVHAVNIIVFT